MSLDRVRKKYPEFSKMSDEDLAESLYQSHYSNMSKKEYYKKLGMDEPSSKGLTGIANDVTDTLSKLPSDFVDMMKALPSQASDSIDQIANDPLRALKNVGAGVGEGAIGAINIPSNLANYLKKKEVLSPGIENAMSIVDPIGNSMQKTHIGDLGIEKAIGLGDTKPGDALLRGISSFIPYSRIGKAAEGLEALGARSAGAAAYGAGQNQNPLQTALIGILAEAGVKGLGNIDKIAPSKLFRGNLTAKQLADNLRAAQGTETGLGDIVQNPNLKKFLENTAPDYPHSGAHDPAIRTGNAIADQGHILVNNLLNDAAPEDTGKSLVDALTKASTDTRTIKNAKWEKVNQLAEKNKVQTDRSGLRSAASKMLAQVNDDPDLAAFRSGEDKSLLSRLAKIDQPKSEQSTILDSITGKPFELPIDQKTFSLRDTDFLRGELGERAYKAHLENDQPKRNLYLSLKDSLDKDIADSIGNSSSDELKNARDDAMKFHKEEFAPFEDNDIMKFTRRDADPDTIVQHFIKNGRLTDRANLLRKLSDKLPADKKGLLPYAYFSNAIEDGKVNPNKLNTLYRNLGDRQKEAIFPDGNHKQNFDDYSNLVHMNQRALSPMFNPKTGWMSGGAMQMLGQILAASGGFAHGGAPEAIALGGAAHVVPGMAMRPIVKALTSPTLREAIVNKMIAIEPKRNIALEKKIQDIIDTAGSQGGRSLAVPLAGYLNENQQTGSQ